MQDELNIQKKRRQLRRRKAGRDVSIVSVSSVIYMLMAAGGALITLFYHESLVSVLALPDSPAAASRLAIVVALVTGVLFVTSLLFEDWFISFQRVKLATLQLLGPTSRFTAFYLAAISAVGEELLFRAALQPIAGLLLTSVLFGLLHLGPEGRVSSWSVWAFLAGLLLGWTYEATGSLWPAMIAHFLVNFLSIVRLQTTYRRLAEKIHAGAKKHASSTP